MAFWLSPKKYFNGKYGGDYWSSTVNGANSIVSDFSNATFVLHDSYNRGSGFSLRCVAE
jgi:hypothetical protein